MIWPCARTYAIAQSSVKLFRERVTGAVAPITTTSLIGFFTNLCNDWSREGTNQEAAAMSEMQEVETFDPQWDVADRLQKALRIAWQRRTRPGR